MPSLSDFGLGPEAPESERRRARRYRDDESGARPLPTAASDYLDEPVDLPGVTRHAALYFGIGAGLGVAVLSIAAALYFGGYLERPALGAAPETSALVPEARLARFEEARDADALAFARVADAKLSATPVFAAAPAVEAPDISMIEQPPAPPARPPTPRAPRSNLSEELEALDRAYPTPLPPPAEPTAPAETSSPTETRPPERPSPESPY